MIIAPNRLIDGFFVSDTFAHSSSRDELSGELLVIFLTTSSIFSAAVMTNLSIPASVDKVWVGATDIPDIGVTWRFQDGVALSPNQISWGRVVNGPIEPTGGEHCMDYFVPGSENIDIPGPNDETCTVVLSYICERQIT